MQNSVLESVKIKYLKNQFESRGAKTKMTLIIINFQSDLSRQDRIAAINCALEAGLAVMYVLTAPEISSQLLADNVIERTIGMFQNTS